MINNKALPWPSFTNEIESVKDVLSSNRVNYWTGDQCRKFEKEFAAWSDSNMQFLWQTEHWHLILHLKH